MLSNRGVWPAWLWMFVLALLLGWIPFIGPAIAGFVGGLQAGDTRSALIAAVIPSVIVAGLLLLLGSVIGLPIIAALIPSVIVAGLLFLLGSVVGLPIVAALVSAGLVVILLIGSLPLLAGAFLGGMVSERRAIG